MWQDSARDIRGAYEIGLVHFHKLLIPATHDQTLFYE
jgi:hypothetical protein